MLAAEQKIGPYTLVRPLGSGAFGSVWLVERRGIVTTCLAMKISHTASFDREAVRQEAQVWVRASGHPNVLPVIEAEDYGGQVVIVSEYADGGSLADWLDSSDGKAPSLDAAVMMASGILTGLQHLHERRIVHRDLKPENVLLQGDMPRLTDFGLSRIFRAGKTSKVAGTPAYMAPEVFDGSFSAQSDLWSVAVMLFELLAGRLPYEHRDMMALMLAIAEAAGPTFPEGFPDAIRPIVLRGMKKEPNERFSSAREMLIALQSAAAEPAGSSGCAIPQRFSIPESRSSLSRPSQRQRDLLHNFPAEVNTFVGREHERESLRTLLVGTGARLVTLIGIGGTGKTRLAQQVAAEIAETFPDGVWMVDLAGLSDAREVPTALALALKLSLSQDGGVPSQVFTALRNRRCLLVLDNFEQVIEAASFVEGLLRECPQVICLVTSQHLLRIGGEAEYVVSSLDVPPEDTPATRLLDYTSVSLFVDRACAAKPQFELTDEKLIAIAEICRRLEGIPLAIELTAALTRGMTPQQILPRLKDRFRLLLSARRDLDSRRRSLRGALDWSYELLTEEERALFVELSVIKGSFAMEDVEAVCTPSDAFLLLISLRDKSLLRAEERGSEMWYSMLDTLRDYASEKLDLMPEANECRERHAVHFLALARQWGDRVARTGEASQRLAARLDDLRAGMDWAEKMGRNAIVVGYGQALGRFYAARGLHAEGVRRLGTAETAAREGGDRAVLEQILMRLGRIAEEMGSLEDARGYYDESCGISRQLGNQHRMIPALANLGNIAWFESDLETAQERYEEGLAIARRLGEPGQEASLLTSLTNVARERGMLAEAQRHADQSITIQTRLGNAVGLANALWNYAEVACLLGNYDEAVAKLQACRRIVEDTGDVYRSTLMTIDLGKTLLEAARLEEAETVLNEGLRLASEARSRRGEMCAYEALARLAGMNGDLGRAQDLFLNSAEIAVELQDQRLQTMILQHFGKLLLRLDRRREARRVLKTALIRSREAARLQVETLKELLAGLENLSDENDEIFAADASTVEIVRAFPLTGDPVLVPGAVTDGSRRLSRRDSE